MSDPHPVERLFATLDRFTDYPAGTKNITARIAGTAFFPGGMGLWVAQADQPPPPWPLHGVMVLGHNFDSEAGYLCSLAQGAESLNSPTWRNLLALLRVSNIPPETCFFTNAYMGLKVDDGRATGQFPGARDPEFVRFCRDFLGEQIRMQQPRLVLTLGTETPRLLAPLAPELARAWANARNFQTLDTQGAALVYPVHFPNIPHPTAVAALTHPSLRGPNVRHRRYQEYSGDAAERALILEALRLVADE